jgi:riboflavin biosynthesis pyrimidine reductase
MAGIIAGMRRLLPHPVASIDVREAYDLPRPRPSDRPWLNVCMVASIDGSTVIDQRSAALSSPVDLQVLLTLRDLADVLVVGAGTVRVERYGPPRKAGQRVGVISRTGRVPFDTELFTTGRGFLILPENAPEVPVESIRAGIDHVDIARALALLDADVVQAEGGAALNAALAMADVIDELDLTISPQLAGGAGPRLVQGADSLQQRMDLDQVCEDDGFLFTRWLRRR